MEYTAMEHKFYHMLYLAFAQIKGLELKNLQLNMTAQDLEQLYNISKFHGTTALVYDALVQIPLKQILISADDEECRNVFHRFKQTEEKSIRKNLLMDGERAKLFAYMKEHHIWYMPLKGVILKDLYPKIGERQMVDNDILFDQNYQKQIRSYFVSQGYKVVSYNRGNHDVYVKNPIYNFEMHTSLYGVQSKKGWIQYYEHIIDKLESKDGVEYHFKTEDFYIYFMSHAYKHYDISGIGLKFLLDLYVFLEHYEKQMDWNYVAAEIQKLNMTAFERNSRQLLLSLNNSIDEIYHREEHSLKTISSYIESHLEKQYLEMLAYICNSGSHGTVKNRVENKVKLYEHVKHPKLHYYVKKSFPDYTFMKIKYPRIAKYKILLPIAWIYRGIDALIHHPKKIFQDIKWTWKI